MIYLTGLGLGEETSMTLLPFVTAFADHVPSSAAEVLLAPLVAGEVVRIGKGLGVASAMTGVGGVAFG